MSEFIAPPCHDEISIIFEDEYILAINKPSGLLSLSGKNPANLDSVHYRLTQQYPHCTLVHRLDFGTSGVMLVAKNKHINGLLTKQFQQGQIAKTYTAILLGKLSEQQADIHLPIAKDDFPYMKVCHQSGKTAHSHYHIIAPQHDDNKAYSQPTTKVLFTPFTGRTHQLRLHSQYIGHPIIGCDLYTKGDSQSLAPRLMLHATSLSFIHPVTNKPLKINCPSPF